MDVNSKEYSDLVLKLGNEKGLLEIKIVKVNIKICSVLDSD
jgi:hypothetical protein